MATNRLTRLTALGWQEWRRFRFSPVWIIGLVCGGFLAITESGVSKVMGYPTANEALGGFQLASSTVFGFIVFLLAAGSLAADLEGSRKALIFSRPIAKLEFLLAKFTGVFFLALATILPVLLLSVSSPLLYGTWKLHALGPFLKVMLLGTIPMLAYVAALALMLTAVFRRVLIVLPVFIVYFFTAGLSGSGASSDIDLFDFSMRLYPHEVAVAVPLQLEAISFYGLLEPLSSALVVRAVMYLGLAGLLLALACFALHFDLDTRLGGVAGRAWARVWSRNSVGRRSSARWVSNAARPVGFQDPIKKLEAGPRSVSRGSLSQELCNELKLLAYSARMLVGRNLLATAMIMAGLLLIVFTYHLGPYQTREGLMLYQLEMFAPLLGIVLFSDLVATEFEGRRIDLLRVRRRGTEWILLRRLVHGLCFSLLACLMLLVVFRVWYTEFRLLPALGIAMPGVLFFGMLGLLAATAARRSLVGYAAGTAAMVLSVVLKEVEPLTTTSFDAREHLANNHLLGEWNWLLAKGVFCVLAAVLVVTVLRMVARPESTRRLLICVAGLVLATYGGLHLAWSGDGRRGAPEARMVDLQLRETPPGRTVRRAVVTSRGYGSRVVESTALIDVQEVRKDESWEVAKQRPVDLTLELDIPHLELEVSVDPREAALEGQARFAVIVLAGPTDRIRFFLGTELEVEKLVIDGALAEFDRHADMIEVLLPEAVEAGKVLKCELRYGGRLRLPQNLRFERAAKDFLFAVTRWYPCLRGTSDGPRPLFSCVATVRTPLQYHVAAATFVRRDGDQQVFRWESGSRVDSVPLCVGTFRVHESAYRDDIRLTFCTFSAKPAFAERILKRGSEILRQYEQVFGPYPYRQVAIVENRYQSGGGSGFCSVVTIKPERLVPEHEERFINGYLPHELAHLWFGNGLTPWVAEASAVYANYIALKLHQGKAAANEFLDIEFYPTLSDPETAAAPLVKAQGALPYVKGGYLLKMLGDSRGESALLGLMGSFQQNLLQGHRADADEMSDAFVTRLKAFAGPELEGFVDNIAHSVKRFDPAIVAIRQDAAGASGGAQIQLQHFGEIRFPVPVTIVFTDGTTTNQVWDVQEEKGVLNVAESKAILRAEIDAEHNLLDWNRSNNRATPTSAGQSPVVPSGPSLAGWRTYGTADGLPDLDIRDLTRAFDGPMLTVAWSLEATRKGRWPVGLVRDDHWEAYASPTEPIALIRTIASGPDGSMWFGGRNRIQRVRGEARKDWLLSELRHGGPIGSGIFTTAAQVASGLPGSKIYSLHASADGRLWVATDHGLIRFVCQEEDCTWNSHSGLEDREVFALAEDDSGGLWAGTDQGVYQLSGDTAVPVPQGPKDLVLGLAAGPSGVLWCGTYRSGLWKLQDNLARQYSPPNAPVPDTIFSCVACDQQGRVFTGTPDGLLQFDGQEWKLYDRDNSGLPSNRIHCVDVDGQGRVWLGTDAGLTRFEPER